MIFAISILFFGLMYWVKGGALGRIPGVLDLRDRSKVFDRLLDGKVASTIGVFLFFFAALYLQLGVLLQYGLSLGDIAKTSALLAGAWLLGVAPSMGEEGAAIGRIGHHSGPYIEQFGMSKGIRYGWTKGVQRGVFLGAPFTILTDLPHFILLGALFPVLHFVGQQLEYMIRKRDGWEFAEPLIGAVIIGIGVGFYLN